MSRHTHTEDPRPEDYPADAPAGEEPAGEEPAVDASASGAPEPDASGGGGLDELRERVRSLEDDRLRRAAEFQNYRRRTQEDLAQAGDRGRAEVLTRLLDVFDDLLRSREAAEQAATDDASGARYDALKAGVDLVYRKFEDTLAGLGVRRIDAVGQPFDEALHEALMQQVSDEHASGTVVTEIQPGYTLGDRVLRHARVAVAQ